MSDQDIPTHSSDDQRFLTLGKLALGLGLAMVLARSLETAYGIPAMPRFWYQNDSLWWLVGLAGIGAGTWLLGRAEHPGDRRENWKPTRPGRRFGQLVLYTRDGCKLCDEAEALILSYHRWLPPITAIDIDADPQLIEKYGTCVPVVALDGKVRFRGRINETLLRRLIEGAPPAG